MLRYGVLAFVLLSNTCYAELQELSDSQLIHVAGQAGADISLSYDFSTTNPVNLDYKILHKQYSLGTASPSDFILSIVGLSGKISIPTIGIDGTDIQTTGNKWVPALRLSLGTGGDVNSTAGQTGTDVTFTNFGYTQLTTKDPSQADRLSSNSLFGLRINGTATFYGSMTIFPFSR